MLMESPVMAMHPYAPILTLIMGVIVMVIVIMALTHLIGPKRGGAVKDDTYESGMAPIGDARGRFKVQFYVFAMLFLLFDVEIVFLWPWAMVFYRSAMGGEVSPAAVSIATPAFLLGAMGFFFMILVVGFIYDWGKGAFRWE